jgi:3-phytase
VIAAMLLASCSGGPPPAPEAEAPAPEPSTATVAPVLSTEPVAVDSDDPAIWIHPTDPAQSLVLGTDKGGSVYVFNLNGAIIPEKTLSTGGRFNNVDVEYGFELAGESVDIAVATDRPVRLLRVLRLPEMTPIDNGGIEVFAGEEGEAALPMGIALYKRPADGAVFAIVSRKTGPSGSYLWQYLLEDDGSGQVTATKVREFGTFSDATSPDDEGVPELGEIESVAVDDALGYLYYSDELTGVRKYLADPDAPDANVELALFATEGFAEQREGISIYTIDDGTGYILISDQQANAFRIFNREGEPGDPHDHRLLKVIQVATNESDGSEVTNATLGERFPSGLFVAMSDDRTFQYYSWEDIAGEDLKKAPNGAPPTP